VQFWGLLAGEHALERRKKSTWKEVQKKTKDKQKHKERASELLYIP